MKKSVVEMAWKEPKDNRGPDENRDRRPHDDGAAPDLDQVFGNVKKMFGGGGGGGSNTRHLPTGGKGLGSLALFLLVILLLGWLATGIYKVDAGEKGIELFLGKHSATKGPGLTWRFPKPIGNHHIINVQKRYSQKITGDGANQEALMLTKDEAMAAMHIEFQYQIDADYPEKYWFASLNPQDTLRQVIESAARERVGQTMLDDVLTRKRAQLTEEIKELAQSVIDGYDIGLQITNINLEDSQPPEEVQWAFTDAINAQQDEEKKINEANAYRDSRLAEARGEVEREIRQAEAYRDSKIAQASGEAERYIQFLAAYRLAPEVTRERLYLETMEQVLEKTSKIIMGPQESNNLMMLPLDKLFSGRQDRISRELNDESADSHQDTIEQESILRNTIKERMNDNQRPSPVIREVTNNRASNMNQQMRNSGPRSGLSRSGY